MEQGGSLKLVAQEVVGKVLTLLPQWGLLEPQVRVTMVVTARQFPAVGQPEEAEPVRLVKMAHQ